MSELLQVARLLDLFKCIPLKLFWIVLIIAVYTSRFKAHIRVVGCTGWSIPREVHWIVLSADYWLSSLIWVRSLEDGVKKRFNLKCNTFFKDSLNYPISILCNVCANAISVWFVTIIGNWYHTFCKPSMWI